VYVTCCDLEKSFVFVKIVEIYKPSALSHSCVNISYIIHAVFTEVCEIERFLTAKVTFSVTKVTGNGVIRWATLDDAVAS